MQLWYPKMILGTPWTIRNEDVLTQVEVCEVIFHHLQVSFCKELCLVLSKCMALYSSHPSTICLYEAIYTTGVEVKKGGLPFLNPHVLKYYLHEYVLKVKIK